MLSGEKACGLARDVSPQPVCGPHIQLTIPSPDENGIDEQEKANGYLEDLGPGRYVWV
jgi:hypothetical protein